MAVEVTEIVVGDEVIQTERPGKGVATVRSKDSMGVWAVYPNGTQCFLYFWEVEKAVKNGKKKPV